MRSTKRMPSPLDRGRARAAMTSAIILALILVSALSVLSALPAAAKRRVEVYAARHRTAEELLPLAATAIGDEGEVALDAGTNTLVLIGSPTAVAEALALLASQDRRLRTLVLSQTTRRSRELTAQGLSIRWQAKSGAFRVGQLGPAQPAHGPGPASAGSSAASSTASARSDDGAELRAMEAMRSLEASMTAKMRVTEGSRTRIETGTTVPYTVVGRSGPSTQWVDATSGFEASARILGDGRVQVDIASFARELLPGGALDGTAGSNVVTLEPGVLVAIGGLRSDRAVGRTETGSGQNRGRSTDETILLLRADVE